MNQPSTDKNPLQLTRRNIIANIATLLSGSTAAQGMTAVTLLFTARQLGAVHYGQYVAAFTLVSFTAVLFSLGLDLWLLRNAGREPTELARLTGSLLAIKGCIGGIWLAVFFGLASILDPSRFPVELIRLSALAVWLDGMFSINLTAFRASLRNTYSAVLEAGTVGLWLLMTFLLTTSGQAQPLAYLGVRIVASLVGVVVSSLLVWHKVQPRVSLLFIKRALGEALPFAGSEILAMANMRQDVLIVALMLGDKAAGLYSPAVGIINAAFVLPAAIYLVITPVLSNLFATNVDKAWVIAKQGILLLALAGLAASIGLVVIAGPIISLLGVTFHGSREVLLTLSVILFSHSISFGMASILVATGQQKKRTIIQAIVVAINAILDFAIVHWAGIIGVAIVYVISDILLLVGYSWLVWRNRSAVINQIAEINPIS
jgi:O-antigen/teichoic acid export membrane protein